MLVIFFLMQGLSLAFNVNSALGQENQCGGALSTTPFDSIEDGLRYYCQCNFLTQTLNVDCIRSSCPMLSGVCPLYSNGSINQPALNSAVSILNTCIGQNGLVCNINITHSPIVQISFTTAELIPASVAKGTINQNLRTGYRDNLNAAKFTLANSTNPITLIIQTTNVNNNAQYNCLFTVPQNSTLNLLQQILPLLNILNPLLGISSSKPLNFPNLTSSYHSDTSSIVSIDLSTQPPTFKVLNYQFNLTGTFSNFVTSNGQALDKNTVDLFNKKINTFLQGSTIPTNTIDFLSTYVTLGLQAAQLNCNQQQ